MLLFAWLDALFLEAIIWRYVFIILSIIVFLNSIIGFIVVIAWLKARKKGRKFNSKNKSGLSKDEFDWLHKN